MKLFYQIVILSVLSSGYLFSMDKALGIESDEAQEMPEDFEETQYLPDEPKQENPSSSNDSGTNKK